jgi:hypothetical protein
MRQSRDHNQDGSSLDPDTDARESVTGFNQTNSVLLKDKRLERDFNLNKTEANTQSTLTGFDSAASFRETAKGFEFTEMIQ